jgi:hypothetical protein
MAIHGQMRSGTSRRLAPAGARMRYGRFSRGHCGSPIGVSIGCARNDFGEASADANCHRQMAFALLTERDNIPR